MHTNNVTKNQTKISKTKINEMCIGETAVEA